MSSINYAPVDSTQNRKSNSLRNGLLGTATGAVIGGGVGYLTTNLAKDGTVLFLPVIKKMNFLFDHVRELGAACSMPQISCGIRIEITVSAAS